MESHVTFNDFWIYILGLLIDVSLWFSFVLSDVWWVPFHKFWWIAWNYDWSVAFMSFFCQTSQTRLSVLSNCPSCQGKYSWHSILVEEYALWPANTFPHQLWFQICYFWLPQEDSGSRRHDIISSFLTEIILALKEVFCLLSCYNVSLLSLLIELYGFVCVVLPFSSIFYSIWWR